MKFTPTIIDDLPQISEWAAADPFHQNQNVPSWWLSGTCWLAACFEDNKGPVVYIKVEEGDYYRLHCQFAPSEIVSKRRLIVSMLKGLPILLEQIGETKAKGVVFQSTNPSLIKFLSSLNFQPSENDDYVLRFEREA